MCSSDLSEGVVVASLLKRGTADKAGIEPGDIILKIDGIPVSRLDDYYIAVLDAVRGQELVFELLRGDKLIKKVVTL